MDSSLLDVSADFISETPKKKPMSPKSFAKDVVERLAIVTPSGRVDAAEFLSSNTNDSLLQFTEIITWHKEAAGDNL